MVPLFSNTGRLIFKIAGVIIYLAFAWTLREMIHEAYEPERQPQSMVTYP